MMSLLLCHECYCWVEPRDGRCPECQQTVDPAAADPSADALRTILGEIVAPLGEVRVPRKMLPEFGMLYATTNGLCFVPHRVEQMTRLVEGTAAGSSLFWSLAALFWSPLLFVLPFVRSKSLQETRVPVLRPQFLTPADSQHLPVLLMQDPGAFFVPRRTVRLIRRRRHKWIVERLQGTPVKLRVESNRRIFHERMSDLVHSDVWHGLGVGF